MLIERYGCFGGKLTQVGVEGIGWYRRPATVDVEGIGIEFEQRTKAHQASYKEEDLISPYNDTTRHPGMRQATLEVRIWCGRIPEWLDLHTGIDIFRNSLIWVEGELNAISLWQVCHG